MNRLFFASSLLQPTNYSYFHNKLAGLGSEPFDSRIYGAFSGSQIRYAIYQMDLTVSLVLALLPDDPFIC